MKWWRGPLSFAGLAALAGAMLVHGCQSPESFHLIEAGVLPAGSGGHDSGPGGLGSGGTVVGTGGRGSGGISGTGGLSSDGGHASGGSGGHGGMGGHVASGGTGGAALGGAGLGGRIGSGGRASGGSASGGSASGGGGASGGITGQGGRGGRSGTGGGGGRASGGRSGAGGSPSDNCIGDIQSNGYAYGAVPACSACKDNGTSLEAKCKAVIDCFAPHWPCTGNCLTECYNSAGASAPVMSCVTALTTAACGM